MNGNDLFLFDDELSFNGGEPLFSNRGPTVYERFQSLLRKVREWRDRRKIPIYRPEAGWNKIFLTLGWEYVTVLKFWKLFCKANKSRSGEINFHEFLMFFNLERTPYVEKCFTFFDSAGGGTIDFLEFIVSVSNICSLDVQTLTNFTFDLYDIDSDGLLSCPEIEIMNTEFYGKSGVKGEIGRQCMKDMMVLAEENGAITLDLFSIFAKNHSLLLFPVFQIQQSIQSKVMGVGYWLRVQKQAEQIAQKNKAKRNNNISKVKRWLFGTISKRRSSKKKLQRSTLALDPRKVQVMLREFKNNSMIDPAEALAKYITVEEQFWNNEQDWSERREHPLVSSLRQKLRKINLTSRHDNEQSKKNIVNINDDVMKEMVDDSKDNVRPESNAKISPTGHQTSTISDELNHGTVFVNRPQSALRSSSRATGSKHGSDPKRGVRWSLDEFQELPQFKSKNIAKNETLFRPRTSPVTSKTDGFGKPFDSRPGSSQDHLTADEGFRDSKKRTTLHLYEESKETKISEVKPDGSYTEKIIQKRRDTSKKHKKKKKKSNSSRRPKTAGTIEGKQKKRLSSTQLKSRPRSAGNVISSVGESSLWSYPFPEDKKSRSNLV